MLKYDTVTRGSECPEAPGCTRGCSVEEGWKPGAHLGSVSALTHSLWIWTLLELLWLVAVKCDLSVFTDFVRVYGRKRHPLLCSFSDSHLPWDTSSEMRQVSERSTAGCSRRKWGQTKKGKSVSLDLLIGFPISYCQKLCYLLSSNFPIVFTLVKFISTLHPEDDPKVTELRSSPVRLCCQKAIYKYLL